MELDDEEVIARCVFSPRNVNNYIKTLASMAIKHKNSKEMAQPEDWGKVEISPEVMAMTFDNRVDLGTTDYRTLINQELEHRFQ